MNYTLKQLQDQVSQMIEEQGEDAHCAAWVYTKEDIQTKVDDYELIGNIMCDVGDSDYIYEKIQDKLDEATEERINKN